MGMLTKPFKIWEDWSWKLITPITVKKISAISIQISHEFRLLEVLKYLPTKLKWPSGWLKTDQSPLESTRTVCSSTVAVYHILGKFSVVLEALITGSSLSVMEWPSILDSRKRFLIGLSKTAGEPDGANKATTVYTEEMAHVKSTRWLLQRSSTDFNINLLLSFVWLFVSVSGLGSMGT